MPYYPSRKARGSRKLRRCKWSLSRINGKCPRKRSHSCKYGVRPRVYLPCPKKKSIKYFAKKWKGYKRKSARQKIQDAVRKSPISAGQCRATPLKNNKLWKTKLAKTGKCAGKYRVLKTALAKKAA